MISKGLIKLTRSELLLHQGLQENKEIFKF